MNIRYLEIMEAIVQEGTFTGAAKKLFITQSAVSHAVAELELQAGTVLFQRLPRGVCLTNCGQILLEEAQSILSASRRLDQKITNLEAITPVHIASSITVATYLLPRLMKGIQKQHPDLVMNVRVASAAETLRALQVGTADIAFMEGLEPPNAFHSILLGTYEICAVCSPWFTLPKSVLSLQELNSYPILLREKGSAIRDTFDALLSLANQQVCPVWESVNSFSLLQAAKAGLGIAILPEPLVSDEIQQNKVRLVRIDGQSMENKMLAVIHNGRYLTRPMEIILNFIDRQDFTKQNNLV